jgi:hypothetical protein
LAFRETKRTKAAVEGEYRYGTGQHQIYDPWDAERPGNVPIFTKDIIRLRYELYIRQENTQYGHQDYNSTLE